MLRRALVIRRVAPYLSRIISTTRRFSHAADEEVVSHPPHDSASSCSVDSLSDSSDESEESSSWASAPQVLRAYVRNRRARCVARVREQGRIPAVLVDSVKSRRPKDGSTDLFLSLDAKPIAALLKFIGKRDFVSRLFDMDIYRNPDSQEIKESLQVLPRNLNYGPGKTNILNVQFIRATPGQTLKLGVPLEYLGADRCPGLLKGGTLMKLAKYVVYNCKATEVPAKLVVDMTVLEIGDRVQIQDLEVDFDLLHSDKTMAVCEIVKDAATLKAKAKRLKNELFFKKKALADKECGAKNPVQSQDEVDAEEEDLQDEDQPTEMIKRHRGLMKCAFKGSIVKNLPKGSISEKHKVVGKSARAKNISVKSRSASHVEDEEPPPMYTRKQDVGLRKSGTRGSSGSPESKIPAKSRSASRSASDVEVAEQDEESLPMYTRKQAVGLRKIGARGSSGSAELNNPAKSWSTSDVEDAEEDKEPQPKYTMKRPTGIRNSGTRGSTEITKLNIPAKSRSAEEDEEPRPKYTRKRAVGITKPGTGDLSGSADNSLKRRKPSERRLVGTRWASNRTEQQVRLGMQKEQKKKPSDAGSCKIKERS